MTTKNFIYMIDYLCQIEFLLMNILTLLKIPGFLFKIQGFSRLKKSQTPGFSRFPGKVATLMIFETFFYFSSASSKAKY